MRWLITCRITSMIGIFAAFSLGSANAKAGWKQPRIYGKLTPESAASLRLNFEEVTKAFSPKSDEEIDILIDEENNIDLHVFKKDQQMVLLSDHAVEG